MKFLFRSHLVHFYRNVEKEKGARCLAAYEKLQEYTLKVECASFSELNHFMHF